MSHAATSCTPSSDEATSVQLAGPNRSVQVAPELGLLVDSFENANLALASRNNPRLHLVDPLHVNVYDVVNSRYIVLSQAALEQLKEALQS